MSEFDATQYFNQRAQDLHVADLANPLNDRLAELARVSEEKQKYLAGRVAQVKARDLANQSSLVKQWGLDAESLAGRATNLGASVYSGASRVAGDITGFVTSDLEATTIDASLSEDQIAAIGRVKQGKGTPEDTVLANARKNPGSYSPIEMFDKAAEARARSANVNEAFDRGNLVHTGLRNGLTDQLGENFQGAWDQTKTGASALWNGDLAGSKDLATGVAKLIYNAGEAAGDNPGAASEYIAENMPQLAIGALGKMGKAAMLVSNAGYASENYQQGIVKFQKENGGAYPPSEERQKMAVLAASLALAEHAANLGELRAAGGAARAVLEGGKTGVVQSTRNAFKVALHGGLEETATEGYQTWGEGRVNGTPATPLQIYEGAAIGGISGAGLSGGGRAAGEIAKATPEHVAERQGAAARQAAQGAAITSGDVSALVTPGSPLYAPSNAISALYGNSQAATATPETKQGNLVKAGEIVAGLQKERDAAQSAYDAVTPAGLKQNQETLAMLQTKLAAEIDPVKAKDLQESVDLVNEQIASAPKPDTKETARRKASLDAVDGHLQKATQSLAQFNELLNSGTGENAVDVPTQVAAINTKVDEADPVAVAARSIAVDKLINLSMAVPEQLDTTVAAGLANDLGNGLNAAQRSYLRAFSEARVADNALKSVGGVSQEIYHGGNGNMGITQHRQAVVSALASNQQGLADRVLATLQNFEEDHKAKADLSAKALETYQKGGRATQVIRTLANTWEINKGKLLDWGVSKEAQKNGAVSFHKKTPNPVGMVSNFKAESGAIAKTYEEMKAAYALKFHGPATPAVQGAANVQVVPQAHVPGQAATAPSDQAVQAPASVAPVVEAGSAAGVVAGAGTAGVEAAGVAAIAEAVAPTQQTEKTGENSVDSQVSHDTGVKGVEQVTDAATVSNQSTESSTKEGFAESAEQTSTEPAQIVAEPVEGATEAPGNLAVMQTKSPEGTVYDQRNVIADYFTQSASREGDATQRPLVVMNNFLSEGWDSIMKFVQSEKLSDEQLTALRTFWGTATEWSETIQKNLFRKADPKYWAVDDLMQFLVTDAADGKGKLELAENIKTAMSYALLSWVSEQASRAGYNTDAEINQILGREESHAVEDHERAALANVGTRQNVVANTVGRTAVQALGMKAAKGAPVNLMPMLESALGAHIFKLALDQGLMERSTVSGKTMAALMGSQATDQAADHLFLQLARDSEGKPVDKAEALYKANSGTQNILDKLFSVEPLLKEPTLEAAPFTQATTKNTSQAVPSVLARAMKHANAGASYVRQDMYHLVQSLTSDIALQIAGGISASAEDAHVANRAKNEAKNDGLKRELQRITDFVPSLLKQAEGMSTALFFDHTVWKQQRVGISTNTINPQTSKVHRQMLFRKSWEVVVSPADQAQMDNYRLRVAEGLGIKTDKQSNELSLEQHALKVVEPKIKDAVAVIQKSLAGEDLRGADQETLLAGVQAGGKSFHSLDALMALAHEANAQGQDFKVQMMGEVDGVTNGPMFSHFLMGAAESVDKLFELLNRGGFFEDGNKHDQYNLWRGAVGHFDLYETTAGHMVRDVQALITNGIAKSKFERGMPGAQVGIVTNAIYSFTGTLADKDGRVQKAGRNIIKTPLTAMVFGSSVYSAIESMANKFVESIYAGVEDASQGKSGAQSNKQLIENINLLLSQADAPVLSTKMTVAQLMEHEFKGGQLDGLKRTFKRTVGAAVETTMKADFASYIEKRQQFNLAAQTSFEIYNGVYQALREQMVADLVKSGDIQVNEKTGQPLHDLTAAQEGELRKRLSKMAPVINTPMSKDSGSLNAGLYMSKSDRKLSQKQTYASEIRFGTPFEDGTKSTRAHGFETAETAPGVSVLPMTIHSFDSRVSHYAAMLSEVLNVHDAHGAGLANFEEAARNLNHATWNALLNYSPAAEMQAALSRTVVGLAELIQEGNLPASVMSNLTTALGAIADKQEVSVGQLIESVMTGTKSLALGADDMKLQALAQMQAVDQYALEGGNYKVTNKDRADAAALRAALSSALSEKETAAIVAVQAVLEDRVAEKAETPTEEDPPAAKVVSSPFGTLGEPTIKSDPSLVSFFEANPETTAGAVMQQIYKQLTGEGRMTGFNKELVQQLFKSVGKGLVVKYVTPDTAESAVLAKSTGAARGWFVATEDGKEVIYVLSTAFVNSGLTAEVLLHELTHGALARIIANPQGEAVALVAELNTLREKAAAYAKQNGITGFEAALADVQEFVAWGMTSQAFQRQVIGQVTMQTKTGKNTLVNGMKEFISKVTGLLFSGSDKSKQAQNVNGMTAMIKNVSGLLSQAEQNKSKDASGTALNLSMAAANDSIGAANTYSTLDIHAALNATDVAPAFSTKLSELLGSIVERLHGPFGAYKEAMRKDQALNAGDVWHKALATGVSPFASSALVSPLRTSDQEAHAMDQVEATVRAALEHGENTASDAYRGLDRLFAEAVAMFKPSDFVNQDAYDFIFKVGIGANGRTNHLARFAAFGLAHQEFNKLMQRATKTRPGITGSFAERLQGIFDAVLNFLHEKITGTYAGQRADIKLDRLVGQLVDIEAKKRLQIARRDGEISLRRKIEDVANTVAHEGLLKLADIVDSKYVQGSKYNVVKFAGSAVRATLDHRVADAFQELVKVRLNQTTGRLGFVAGTVNFAFGDTGGLEPLLRAREMQEGARADASRLASKMALGAFANNGSKLDSTTRASITQVFLRTGLHFLTGQFNMAELENLLGNRAATNAAIAGLEAQLTGLGPLKGVAINQANALAAYRVTGKVYAKKMMMNAHNIARMYGTGYESKVSEAQAQQAQPVLAKLIALYAMGYVGDRETTQAKDVLRTENSRTDGGGNGVEFLLAMTKKFDSESKDHLFQGQEALMTHGFTFEIYTPHVEVVTAPEADGEALKRRGYTEGSLVEIDPAHPDQTKRRLYVLEGGGNMPYLSGIVSNTGMEAKGTVQHSGYLDVRTADGLVNASFNADIMHGKQGAPYSGTRPDLSKGGRTYMAPVVNAQGEIVNWRYLMNDGTKDSVLKRENRFNLVMGTIAGSIFDKDTAAEVNTRVFQAMKEMHAADGALRPDTYVLIGPKGTDAESREIWSMLSYQAKTDARRIWGRDGIYVRRDLQDLVFGYRKLSLSNAIKNTQKGRVEAAERAARGMTPVEEKTLSDQFEGLMAKLLTMSVEHALVLHARVRGYSNPEDYGHRAALRVGQGERMWQEIVKETKDIWVIKGITTMMHNIKSNVSLLLFSSVPRSDIFRDHLIAWRGATSYQADSDELSRLQAVLDIGQANGKEVEIRNEMARLSDALDRNPVKKLIEEGLMPTIVEDTSEQEDQYSYKSALTKMVDKQTDKLHPSIKAVGKQIYMAKDTKVYQSLRHITQLSDFMARYTQYVYVTTRKVNPLSHADAIQQSSDDFINYKIPMHRGMQYLDDAGIMPFMKYFLRIQKVIERLAKENPARILLAESLDMFGGLNSTVLASEWTHRIGNNPLQMGALEYPGALQDLAAVKYAAALIK